MADTDHWLDACERSHRALRVRPAFWLGAPLLVVGFVGLLWSLPVPEQITAISPLLNWGSMFLMAAMVYYFIISIPLAIGMVPVIAAIMTLELWLAMRSNWLEPAAALLTLAGMAGLFVGHGGGARAVFRDVQLLMIVPLWALSLLYGRLGIPR